jgi:hypothetical protein
MFAEPSIMETIASVSKALQEYERASGFAPAVTMEATDAAPEAPAVSSGPTADAPAPPPASESQVASLPQPMEAAEATTATAATSVAEVVIGEAGSSLPCPVAAEVNEVCATGEPAAAAKNRPPLRERQGSAPRRSKRSRRRVRPCHRA